jgi:hypothetical protein
MILSKKKGGVLDFLANILPSVTSKTRSTMAWNRYYIFVKNIGSLQLPDILPKLNLGHYRPLQEVSLSATNKPTTLFAGLYNGNLMLVHQELVFKFFEPAQSEEEKRFLEAFPESEIAVLISNESVNLFGFAILDRGVKIRIKDGCDGEIYNDVGRPLPEEQEVLSEEIFMEEELEEMKENGMTEKEIQEMIRFEASNRVPDRLTKRYLGQDILSKNTDEFTLMMYSL